MTIIVEIVDEGGKDGLKKEVIKWDCNDNLVTWLMLRINANGVALVLMLYQQYISGVLLEC